MRRHVVALALLAAGLVCVTPAHAGFSLGTTPPASFSLTLNGSDQTVNYVPSLTINNFDPGSNSAGWNLTITSTQFTTGSRTLPTNASTITGVTFVCASGPCTNPTNAIAYPRSVPAGAGPPAAVKFFNAAAATGLGVFTVTPTVRVSVNGNAFAGTYTSTLTLALVSGP